jgi:hypothetical protein
MRRQNPVKAAVMLLLTGGVLLAGGVSSAEDSVDDVRSEGVLRPGEVMAAAGGAVEVEYRIGGQVRHGVAVPARGGPFAEGEKVLMWVLPEQPERILLVGTDALRIPWYAAWLAAGVAGLLGGAAVLLKWYMAVPTLPRIRWISERHGGA